MKVIYQYTFCFKIEPTLLDSKREYKKREGSPPALSHRAPVGLQLTCQMKSIVSILLLTFLMKLTGKEDEIKVFHFIFV